MPTPRRLILWHAEQEVTARHSIHSYEDVRTAPLDWLRMKQLKAPMKLAPQGPAFMSSIHGHASASSIFRLSSCRDICTAWDRSSCTKLICLCLHVSFCKSPVHFLPAVLVSAALARQCLQRR